MAVDRGCGLKNGGNPTDNTLLGATVAARKAPKAFLLQLRGNRAVRGPCVRIREACARVMSERAARCPSRDIFLIIGV